MGVLDRIKKRIADIKTERALEKKQYEEVYKASKLEAIKKKAEADAYQSQGFEKKIKGLKRVEKKNKVQQYLESVKKNKTKNQSQAQKPSNLPPPMFR
jgi:hypothetical protein